MTTPAYIILLATAISTAAIVDRFWMTQVRPHLSRRFGWRPVHPSEHIPKAGWIGAWAFLSFLAIALWLVRHAWPI